MAKLVTFGNKEILSASVLVGEMLRLGLDPSVLADANSFTCSRGPEPGMGKFILRRKDLDELRTGHHDLVFSESVTLKNLILVDAVDLIPNTIDGTEDDAFLCTVADLRYLLVLGTHVNKSYNVRSLIANPSQGYFLPSVRQYVDGSGDDRYVPWDWCPMLQDLWSKVRETSPIELLPECLELPKMPCCGNKPERFIFQNQSAWHALCHAVQSLGYEVGYDPIAGEFFVADPTESDFAELAETELKYRDRLNEDSHARQGAAYLPSAIRVVFRSVHHDGEEQDFLFRGTYTSGTYTAQNYADVSGLEISELGVQENRVISLYDSLEAVFASDAEDGDDPVNKAQIDARRDELALIYYKSLHTNRPNKKLYNFVLPFVPDNHLRTVIWSRRAIDRDAAFTMTLRGNPPEWKWMSGTVDPRSWATGSIEHDSYGTLLPPQSSTSSTTTTLELVDNGCTGRCKFVAKIDLSGWELEEDNCQTTTTTSTTSTSSDPTTTTTSDLTTTQEPTTTSTDSNCVWDPAPTTTSTSTSTTSTTSTTPDCRCSEPQFCPSEEGQCTYTYCSDQNPGLPVVCTTTPDCDCSTSTTPDATTTSTTSPIIPGDECGGCTYECRLFTLSNGFGSQVSYRWELVRRQCREGCGTPCGGGCAPPTGTCGPENCQSTVTVGCLKARDCEPCRGPECIGRCTYVYSDTYGRWFLLGESFCFEENSSGEKNLVTGEDCPEYSPLNCACEEPSEEPVVDCEVFVGACRATNGEPDQDPCSYQKFSSCSDYCECNRTTTTPDACLAGECLWKWNEEPSLWSRLENPCSPDCPCSPPVYDGHSDCEVARTPCLSRTTTTTPEPEPLGNCCVDSPYGCGRVCAGYMTEAMCLSIVDPTNPVWTENTDGTLIPCTVGDYVVGCCPTTTTTTTSTSTTPDIGACCVVLADGGGATVCVDNVLESTCPGTWHRGQACSEVECSPSPTTTTSVPPTTTTEDVTTTTSGGATTTTSGGGPTTTQEPTTTTGI